MPINIMAPLKRHPYANEPARGGVINNTSATFIYNEHFSPCNTTHYAFDLFAKGEKFMHVAGSEYHCCGAWICSTN